MNSLEYIDREIMFTQKEENIVKTQIESTPNDRELQIQKDVLTIKLKVIKERLSYLQQIKSELEVWYICKKHSYINNYDSNNKRFDITIWLNTKNCGFGSCASFEECLKVKKALEVEENERV